MPFFILLFIKFISLKYKWNKKLINIITVIFIINAIFYWLIIECIKHIQYFPSKINYKNSLNALKKKDGIERLAHFPEKIPPNARNYFMQVENSFDGYNMNYLSYDIDKSYIDEMFNNYKKDCAVIGSYRELYNKFPTSPYSGDALANIFIIQVREKDFTTAKINGQSYLNKFDNLKYTPIVMYWMGKIAEKTNDRDEYISYYRSLIAKYPDNYYAYRAYLKLADITSAIITGYINEKEVEYPYEINKDASLNMQLADIGDYDMLFELNDDDFIKSWIYYRKGDYSHSMLIARDAMEKIEDKPDKYDLRWRLVYPIDYYDTIKEYAGAMGNNAPLILAIVREESYFNPEARSAVGAAGLMQLMPSTAREIAAKYNIDIDSVTDLLNPELNIKLGNYYYAELKSMLNGLDISSVAAYNGGIGSVNKWKKSLYYNDTDEFVEQIPYPETKDYVKKVFRSYWNYIRIYTGNE